MAKEKIEKEKKEEQQPKEPVQPETVKPKKESAKEKTPPKIVAKDIAYHEVVATCACGAEYKTGSTLENIRVDICAACHPFFTGEQKLLDTEGRIEKFKKKYNK